ncbi:DUF742 domain-containing protein [Actinomadura kijaniata]|uniref:DUF742 domain-containing protein n=1 Tax=Actinomadura kijaniata TaxID=46161 RepID=UPI003F1D8FCD
MTGPGSEWLDEEAGPLVRAYALTGGRARPATRGEDLEMITVVVTVGRPAPSPEIGPEHLAILDLCQTAQSVAEISARLGLPLVVVRVLLGDLLTRGHIAVRRPEERAPDVTQKLLREVLHGLERL